MNAMLQHVAQTSDKLLVPISESQQDLILLSYLREGKFVCFQELLITIDILILILELN